MAQSLKDKLRIDMEGLLDATARLVRIDSSAGAPAEGAPFGPGPAAALAEAEEIARSLGFRAENRGYVCTVDLGPEERQLDILAHLDVVPAGEGWTVTAPFEPKIADGRIYGRGTADDKGPAMAALFAMKAVRDLGLPLRRGVRLILGANEESGSADIDWYYAREKAAPMTFSPDANFPVINIEKGMYGPKFSAEYADNGALPRVKSLNSGLRGNMIPGTAEAALEGFDAEAVRALAAECAALTGAEFSLEAAEGLVTVRVEARAAHASLPWDGNTALTAMLELVFRLPTAESEGFKRLCALHEIFPHGDWEGRAAGVAMSDEASGKLTICLDVLRYSPERLEGAFDSRLPVCATEATVRDVLTARLKKAGLEVEDRPQSRPHCVDAESELVRGLMKCYREYTGRDDKPIAIGGGTYVHGIENGVAFGCAMPGTDNRMHGADEFAVIAELELSAKIFAQAIADLCS